MMRRLIGIFLRVILGKQKKGRYKINVEHTTFLLHNCMHGGHASLRMMKCPLGFEMRGFSYSP